MSVKNRLAISLDQKYLDLYQETAALLGMSASSYVASILIEHSPKARAAKKRVIKDLADDIQHFENQIEESEKRFPQDFDNMELDLSETPQMASK
jgi:hypothetical protein